MEEEKYRVLHNEEYNQKTREWVKNKIIAWHDKVKPDYIFLTDTSAVPFGWLFKNTWREMYPGEKVPKFYRSGISKNTRQLESKPGIFGTPGGCNPYFNIDKWRPILEKRFERMKLDKSKTVLVYDEGGSSRLREEGGVHNVSAGFERYKYMNWYHSETARINVRALKELGFKEVWSDGGSGSLMGYTGDLNWRLTPEEIEKMAEFPVKPTRKFWTQKGENIDISKTGVGITEKNPVLRKAALNYIHDLKLIGKEAGIEGRKELEKKKKLEQIVSGVVGVGGVLGSLFFLGSGVTGNAIGNISQSSSSWIGIVLFLVGMAGALFYFRIKKR